MRDFCKNRVPQIQLVEPEGTYLAWLDCRELGMTDDELMAFFSDDAKCDCTGARSDRGGMEKTERIMKNSRTVKIKRSEGLHGI